MSELSRLEAFKLMYARDSDSRLTFGPVSCSLSIALSTFDVRASLPYVSTDFRPLTNKRKRGAYPGWGVVCLIACWAPPSPLMPEQASLFRSGVPLDSPLKGHLLWDLALIAPGLARSDLFHFILFHVTDFRLSLLWPLSRLTVPTQVDCGIMAATTPCLTVMSDSLTLAGRVHASLMMDHTQSFTPPG